MSSEALTTPTAATPAAGTAKRRLSWWHWGALGLVALVAISLLRSVTGVADLDSSGALIAAIGLAMPIAMAAMGGLWAERAGVVNIGLEGMMILGTWGAAYFGYHHGVLAGVLGAIACGVVGGLIHAIATVIFGVDQIVSGVAVNIIGAGIAKYLATRFFTGLPDGSGSQSPTLPQVPSITIGPLSSALADVEKKGWFFLSDVAGIGRALVTNLSVLTIAALALIVLSWWILWRTPFGLRLRSCGESPVAAETLGINVIRYKFMAVLISGGFAGLGGAFLAMVLSNSYVDGQTGGRGYIGLAAMIFGNWRPGGLLFGSALFGYTDALRLRGATSVHAFLLAFAVLLLAIGLWQLYRRYFVRGGIAIAAAALTLVWYLRTDSLPSELTTYTPHIVTLLVLALASQRLRMPAADGKVYRKGEGA